MIIFIRPKPCPISQIDDLPRARLQHLIPNPFAHKKRALQVGPDQIIPLLFGERLKWGFVIIRGIIDQDIDPAEAFDHLSHDGVDVAAVGDISLQRQALHASRFNLPERCQRLGTGTVVGDDDVRSTICQGERDGFAHPSGGSGNQCDLPPSLHVNLLSARLLIVSRVIIHD